MPQCEHTHKHTRTHMRSILTALIISTAASVCAQQPLLWHIHCTFDISELARSLLKGLL